MNNFVAKFDQNDLPILSITDANNVIWILAKPFGCLLQYSKLSKALSDHVSPANRKSSHEFGRLTANLPKTYNVQFNSTFINEAGLFQLIRGSRMPNAVRFKQWVDDELVIQLYERECYDTTEASPVAPHITSAYKRKALTFGEWLKNHIDDVSKPMLDCPGYVYVATYDALKRQDIYKIGSTRNIEARMSSLNTSSPEDFYSVYSYESPNYKSLEYDLHEYFKEKRLKREFFRLSTADLQKLMNFCESY